jgi:protein-L-isoaspartate(D-aspartate) O-methyltransferase
MTAGQGPLLAKRLRLLMELRGAGIDDPRVLGAIEKTPRELFVPANLRDEAYENVALPIGVGQTISQPYVVALMTERLQLDERHKVLEIGTGSGYQTAILARLSRRVFSVERHRELMAEAGLRFEQLSLPNIACRFGDGSKGWPEQAPFDRIIVTAAPAEIPMALVEQLTPDGLMVLPVGAEFHDQKLLRLRRTGPGFETDDLGWVRFVPLISDAVTPNRTPARA